jgi:hypothetical protein
MTSFLLCPCYAISVVGAVVGVVIVIATRSIIDIPTALFAIGALIALIYFGKIREPYIIIIAALVGPLIRTGLNKSNGYKKMVILILSVPLN